MKPTMRTSTRIAGTTVLLLACAVGAAACESGGPAPKAAGPRTVTVFRTDGQLSGDALTRAAEQLRRRAELLGLPDPQVSTGSGTLSLSVAGPPPGDQLAALVHRPALEIRPVLADAVDGSAPGATGTTVPPALRAGFDALHCAASPSAGATPSVSATPSAADPAAGAVACGNPEPADRTRHKFALGPVALKNADIADSSAAADPQGGGWQITVRFTPAGGTAFADLTGRIASEQPPGNQLAVLLDGTVITHPYVQQSITGGEAVITGTFTQDQAKTLAAQLATATLPAGLRPDSP
ncbi:SecDF P1 head subdomain-containing protein [Kitasatospora sp. NPDC088134]|uniref:SecDF P1 head subdomain-containing protein n=1 Tax=Kitasatospora sp. NPDC088134 TaxID=3364071 RepID=UPI003800FBA4